MVLMLRQRRSPFDHIVNSLDSHQIFFTLLTITQVSLNFFSSYPALTIHSTISSLTCRLLSLKVHLMRFKNLFTRIEAILLHRDKERLQVLIERLEMFG